ncbi:helix-turn-helix domain-containing protein [soil metagenome]
MKDRSTSAPATSDDPDLLTTGEVALVLHASRQHVVDLCEQGDLPYSTIGRHRRIRRADVDALMSRTERLTRDQVRSLWLGYATAAKVLADPSRAFSRARRNLELMRQTHRGGGAQRWFDEWEGLLAGPVDDVLEMLASRSPRARELRQNSPFAGALSEGERQRVLRSFRERHPGRP